MTLIFIYTIILACNLLIMKELKMNENITQNEYDKIVESFIKRANKDSIFTIKNVRVSVSDIYNDYVTKNVQYQNTINKYKQKIQDTKTILDKEVINNVEKSVEDATKKLKEISSVADKLLTIDNYGLRNELNEFVTTHHESNIQTIQNGLAETGKFDCCILKDFLKSLAEKYGLIDTTYGGEFVIIEDGLHYEQSDIDQVKLDIKEQSDKLNELTKQISDKNTSSLKKRSLEKQRNDIKIKQNEFENKLKKIRCKQYIADFLNLTMLSDDVSSELDTLSHYYAEQNSKYIDKIKTDLINYDVGNSFFSNASSWNIKYIQNYVNGLANPKLIQEYDKVLKKEQTQKQDIQRIKNKGMLAKWIVDLNKTLLLNANENTHEVKNEKAIEKIKIIINSKFDFVNKRRIPGISEEIGTLCIRIKNRANMNQLAQTQANKSDYNLVFGLGNNGYDMESCVQFIQQNLEEILKNNKTLLENERLAAILGKQNEFIPFKSNAQDIYNYMYEQCDIDNKLKRIENEILKAWNKQNAIEHICAVININYIFNNCAPECTKDIEDKNKDLKAQYNALKAQINKQIVQYNTLINKYGNYIADSKKYEPQSDLKENDYNINFLNNISEKIVSFEKDINDVKNMLKKDIKETLEYFEANKGILEKNEAVMPMVDESTDDIITLEQKLEEIKRKNNTIKDKLEIEIQAKITECDGYLDNKILNDDEKIIYKDKIAEFRELGRDEVTYELFKKISAQNIEFKQYIVNKQNEMIEQQNAQLQQRIKGTYLKLQQFKDKIQQFKDREEQAEDKRQQLKDKKNELVLKERFVATITTYKDLVSKLAIKEYKPVVLSDNDMKNMTLLTKLQSDVNNKIKTYKDIIVQQSVDKEQKGKQGKQNIRASDANQLQQIEQDIQKQQQSPNTKDKTFTNISEEFKNISGNIDNLKKINLNVNGFEAKTLTDKIQRLQQSLQQKINSNAVQQDNQQSVNVVSDILKNNPKPAAEKVEDTLGAKIQTIMKEYNKYLDDDILSKDEKVKYRNEITEIKKSVEDGNYTSELFEQMKNKVVELKQYYNVKKKNNQLQQQLENAPTYSNIALENNNITGKQQIALNVIQQKQQEQQQRKFDTLIKRLDILKLEEQDKQMLLNNYQKLQELNKTKSLSKDKEEQKQINKEINELKSSKNFNLIAKENVQNEYIEADKFDRKLLKMTGIYTKKITQDGVKIVQNIKIQNIFDVFDITCKFTNKANVKDGLTKLFRDFISKVYVYSKDQIKNTDGTYRDRTDNEQQQYIEHNLEVLSVFRKLVEESLKKNKQLEKNTDYKDILREIDGIISKNSIKQIKQEVEEAEKLKSANKDLQQIKQHQQFDARIVQK